MGQNKIVTILWGDLVLYSMSSSTLAENESHQAPFDNLLLANGLTHTDGQLTEDKEMSTILLNLIMLIWLDLLHPAPMGNYF